MISCRLENLLMLNPWQLGSSKGLKSATVETETTRKNWSKMMRDWKREHIAPVETVRSPLNHEIAQHRWEVSLKILFRWSRPRSVFKTRRKNFWIITKTRETTLMSMTIVSPISSKNLKEPTIQFSNRIETRSNFHLDLKTRLPRIRSK